MLALDVYCTPSVSIPLSMFDSYRSVAFDWHVFEAGELTSVAL